MTKPSQKRKTFTRNNFAEHNHNYVNQPQTTQLNPPVQTRKIIYFHKDQFFHNNHQNQ